MGSWRCAQVCFRMAFYPNMAFSRQLIPQPLWEDFLVHLKPELLQQTGKAETFHLLCLNRRDRAPSYQLQFGIGLVPNKGIVEETLSNRTLSVP